MKSYGKEVFLKALGILIAFIIICGFIYTFAMTGISQLLFHDKANGSIIEVDGKKYGCELLAQEFTDDGHMWGRVMNINTETFTDENGSPAMYSGPSNLSPAGEEMEALVQERVKKLKESNPDQAGKVPVDLVTASGSGLDPEISPAAAEYQIPRIAEATGKSEEEIRDIVDKYTEGRFLGIFGEPRVNVLKVNLALDGIL
ncbi:potassium-transporting ATPase subunit KdpC [Lactonifactor longoviformis]|uniref:potassium-transporting ATPase subunit KdpC n=1 Tax=Lactonifactor longoviformis TaxID=341220 RepID=UPI0036F352C9